MSIATRSPSQELVARIRGEEFKQQVALALPERVSPERFARAAVTALMQNPDLAEADHNSIFLSLIRCAQDGLLPDGHEAALVIFKGKAVYMPMIGGFRKIAAEHGWSIRTRVVHAGDEFEYDEGLEPRLYHRPARPGAERGALVAAYAVATHKDGRRETRVLYPEEIEKRRQVSRTKDSGPWREWTAQMWEKTVGRDLFQDLPLGDLDEERVQRVIEASQRTPDEAAALLYGRSSLTPAQAPADVAAEEVTRSGRDGRQVEGAAESQGSPPAASSTPDEEEPSAGEPPEGGDFDVPADVREALDAKARADAAGEELVQGGQYAGKSIAYVASLSDPSGWFSYLLRRPTHPNFAAVKTYAEVYLPEIVQGIAGEQATLDEVQG